MVEIDARWRVDSRHEAVVAARVGTAGHAGVTRSRVGPLAKAEGIAHRLRVGQRLPLVCRGVDEEALLAGSRKREDLHFDGKPKNEKNEANMKNK